MDWLTIVANGGFVLLGSIIGGVGSYIGTRNGIKLQFKNEDEKRKNMVENLLNTLLADEIKYNITEVFMKSNGLVKAIDNRALGTFVGKYSFNSEKCLTKQFDKVEEILLTNPNDETKKILDFYRFIKFYGSNGRDINDYPTEAMVELINANVYFCNKYKIAYRE